MNASDIRTYLDEGARIRNSLDIWFWDKIILPFFRFTIAFG